MSQRWLVPLLVACAGTVSSFACTFGANDLKIVPASAGSGATGGALGNAGSSTTGGGGAASGGTLAGNPSAGSESGGTAAGGEAGAGAGTGGSGGAPTLKCTNHTPKPLAVMTYADLHNVANVDRFALVPTPDGSTVFAIAVVQVPAMMGAMSEDHVVVRTISDSNNGTLRNIQDYTNLGYFQFGGAWATQTALNLFGKDQLNGFVEYSFPINSGNLDLSAPTSKPFETPMDCQQSVRDIRISLDATGNNLSFVASCLPQPNNQNMISLWINTPILGGTKQIAPGLGTSANPDVNNDVRGFVRNGGPSSTNNLILVGGDVGSPPSFFRTGASPALLGSLNPLTLSSGAKVLQQIFATAVPGMAGGAFLMAGTFYDPMTPVTGPLPVTIWAGEVAPDSYGTLADTVPPKQLTPIATYNDAAQVFFPEDVYVQGGTAFVVAEDALIQQNVALWELGLSGGPLLVNYPIYGNSSEALSNPRIAPLSLGSLIAWVDNTATGTEVLASSIGCF